MGKRRGETSSPAPPASSSSSTSAIPTPPKAGSTTSGASTPLTKNLSRNSSAQEIALSIWQQYITETPQRILLLDAFMAFLVVVGAVQFVYCVLAGNYPFNAFLSGFCAAVGQFVLTASLRMQTSEQALRAEGKAVSQNSVKKSNDGDVSKEISSERAFADYVFGSIILHFFCINFIN